MKVTVFGGSGFLGSHVCDKLTDSGYEVTIFDKIASRWKKPEQHMVVGNFLDDRKAADAIKGAKYVYNFAGIADIGEANLRPIDTVKNNILGNALILEACKENQVDRYVYASSVYVYSNSGGFYRCSKQACEQYIEAYKDAYGLDYTILRYGSLYGPRSDTKNAIYRFVKEALEGDQICYYGDAKARREYIHVEDAAAASVEILNGNFANQNIVLTGSQIMTIEVVFTMIAEMLNKDLKFVYKNEPNSTHYMVTPYSFSPKLGKKLVPPMQIDIGQGILHIMEEIHRKMNLKEEL